MTTTYEMTEALLDDDTVYEAAVKAAYTVYEAAAQLPSSHRATHLVFDAAVKAAYTVYEAAAQLAGGLVNHLVYEAAIKAADTARGDAWAAGLEAM